MDLKISRKKYTKKSRKMICRKPTLLPCARSGRRQSRNFWVNNFQERFKFIYAQLIIIIYKKNKYLW